MRQWDGAESATAAPLTAEQAKGCKRVDMSAKVRTPDVLVQPHMASLEMTFYPRAKESFPASYDGGCVRR